MQVIQNALRVLEFVITTQPVGVSEVARQLQFPKSSVQRALLSLENEGWLMRDAAHNGLWVQTPRIWLLAHQGRDVGVRSIVQQPMRWLWEQTNENIHFTQQQGDELVVVDKIESSHHVRVFDPIGTRLPLHVSASGKALLAARPPEGFDSYLRRSPARFTDKSLAGEEELRREIAQVHTNGYAVNRGEWRSEIAGVGVALNVGTDGGPEFGLAISVPTHRLVPEKIPQYGALLLEAKARIERAMTLTPPPPTRNHRAAKHPERSSAPRVGLIVPPEEDAVPAEAAELFPDGVEFVAKGLGIGEMTEAGFDDGLTRLEQAVHALRAEEVDAISLMGTSLSFYRGARGHEEILRRLAEASGGLPVTTMSAAVLKSLGEIGAERVALVTAYSEEMSRRLVRFLEENRIEVASHINLGIRVIADLQHVTDRALEDAVARALDEAAAPPDALLISCGGLRTLGVGNRITERTAIPVVSSAVDGLRQAVALLDSRRQGAQQR